LGNNEKRSYAPPPGVDLSEKTGQVDEGIERKKCERKGRCQFIAGRIG